jgi:hypothetical protein
LYDYWLDLFGFLDAPFILQQLAISEVQRRTAFNLYIYICHCSFVSWQGLLTLIKLSGVLPTIFFMALITLARTRRSVWIRDSVNFVNKCLHELPLGTEGFRSIEN